MRPDAMEFAFLDGCEVAWLLRYGALHSPQARLKDISRFDDRLEAYVDGLRKVSIVNQRSLLLLPWGAPIGQRFATAVLAIENMKPEVFGSMLQRAYGSADLETNLALFGPIVAALSWVDVTISKYYIQKLISASEMHQRLVGVAASGARRLNAGVPLETIFCDTYYAVRARAYRTAGELGRLDLLTLIEHGDQKDDSRVEFWRAWTAARLGGVRRLDKIAAFALRSDQGKERAMDILLRTLTTSAAHDFLRTLAPLPNRQRDLIRGAGIIGDPTYVPWLLSLMATQETARLAGESFSMITGVDMAYRDLDRRKPEGFESGPNDDPADENVALDEDDRLPWPDPVKVENWWVANRARFTPGTAYIVGMPKESADYLRILSDGFQRQRAAAALELAIRNPSQPMFEVRARGRWQRVALARAMGGG